MKKKLLSFLEETGYEMEAAAKAFEELFRLKAIPQNPQHHGEGNVFEHTKLVCYALKELPEWEALPARERGLLFLAALFHDIGKLVCTKEEEGQIISPRHAVTGAKMFRELFYKKYAADYEISFREREETSFLIRFHGLPPLFMEKERMEGFLYRARECVPFTLLYLLAKADVLGRICEDREEWLMAVEYFQEYADEIGCYEKKPEFAGKYTRFRFYRGSGIWPGNCLYDETQFPVYVMAGLPLAGKDTYIANNFSSLPVISLDEIRREWKIGPKEKSRAVVKEARERARVLLRTKQPFVWDATNLITDTRRKVYSLCENYGARVTLIYVEAPYEELLKRNKIRERSVPVAAIDQMLQKMDMPEPTETYEVLYAVEDITSPILSV